MGASWVTMPPVFAPRWVVRMRVCFLTRLTPSTRTLSSARVGRDDLAPGALVLAGDDHDRVALLDLHGYNTSGASEMIFMKRLSRSSRPTGPKMRVPRGSPPSLMITAAFSSKRMYEPSGPAPLLGGPDDDGLDDVALLHTGARDGVLDRGHDDVADARVAPTRATEHPDAQDLPGTRVVGDAQSRLLLNHVYLLMSASSPPGAELGRTGAELGGTIGLTWPSRGSPRPASASWPTAAGSP